VPPTDIELTSRRRDEPTRARGRRAGCTVEI
jgi:hypothetical protein